MNKKILIGIVIFVSIIVIALYLFNSSNGVPKTELEKKAYELWGAEYCTTNHGMEMGGCALTDFKCTLCGITVTNSTTNVPKLCDKCAILTGRCNRCGKLLK